MPLYHIVRYDIRHFYVIANDPDSAKGLLADVDIDTKSGFGAHPNVAVEAGYYSTEIADIDGVPVPNRYNPDIYKPVD